LLSFPISAVNSRSTPGCFDTLEHRGVKNVLFDGTGAATGLEAFAAIGLLLLGKRSRKHA